MIAGPILHPRILAALASAGHKSTVLISDAFYAAATATGSNAEIVHLNLERGTPTITRVVELVSSVIAVEKRTTMRATVSGFDEVQDEVTAILGAEVLREDLDRESFYAAVRMDDLALCIVTGDTRRFGNVLLTVGVDPRG
jgi:L-fucose mutarotase